ncbi:hypothetical protein D9M69_373750 [compost metagenome]
MLHHLAVADRLDAAQQVGRSFVLRIERRQGAHLAFGADQVATAQRGLALAQHLVEVAHLLDLPQRLAGAVVARLDAEHPLVGHLRGGEVALAALQVGLGEQHGDHPGAGAGQGDLRRGVARIGPGRFGEARQAGLVAALLDQRHALVARQGRGATGEQRGAEVQQAAGGSLHGSLPTARDWEMRRGR